MAQSVVVSYLRCLQPHGLPGTEMADSPPPLIRCCVSCPASRLVVSEITGDQGSSAAQSYSGRKKKNILRVSMPRTTADVSGVVSHVLHNIKLPMGDVDVIILNLINCFPWPCA